MRAVWMSLALLAAVPAAAATVTTFDVPGAMQTEVGAVSPSGLIAGDYGPAQPDPCGRRCGFLRMPDGTSQTFSVFRAKDLTVRAVNDSGTVVGQYLKHKRLIGFIRTPDGTVSSIDFPDATTDARSVNASGTVTGFTRSDNGVLGFLRTPGGQVSTFGIPNCDVTFGFGINSAGTVTGICDTTRDGFGFVRLSNGDSTTFQVGGQDTDGIFIDDAGAVAGTYLSGPIDALIWHGYIRDPDGTLHLFDFPGGRHFRSYGPPYMATVGGDRQLVSHIYGHDKHWFGYLRHDDGTIETFDVSHNGLAHTGTFVHGIAPSGMIVGTYTDDAQTYHGYIRTP